VRHLEGNVTTATPGFLNVRREEVVPLLAAAFYFFFVLSALSLLRPARDAIGIRDGLGAIRWLFIGTAVVTLAVNPMFGWLVSRFRRMVFITATYGVIAASLVGFYILFTIAPDAVSQTSGRVFYVWFSVLNLFATMVFWALMADRFTFEQSKRLFGVIAVGGTAGALAGPWMTRVLVEPLGTYALMLVAAALLLVAVGAAFVVAWVQPEQARGAGPGSAARVPAAAAANAVIGGSAWKGLITVFQSRYLLGISMYVLILTVMATFIYFTRLAMVAAIGDDTDTRTAAFANIDLATQTLTLVLQLFVTGHVMRRLGVSVALALLPVVVALGFVGLSIATSFVAFVILEATFRALQRAITRPARETLFTVVSREDKYKSKAVTDTFFYRGGDVLGAWMDGWLGALGLGLLGLASAVVPMAVVWAGLGLWLGRSQESMMASTSGAGPVAAPGAPVPSPVR
jgi:AAA family ATP:ADP antiporter